MSETSTVYCDESGNDGPNYLNPQSPFYVLAGWVTPTSAIVQATVEVESLRAKHCRDAPELKFKALKRKPWSVFELMTRLGQVGLVPVYVLAEKRYCIAGKIIETFLDPVYNSRLASPFSGDYPTKKELANTLYERLSQKSLATFAKAYQNPTQDGLERALREVVAECRRRVNPELAELIEGSVPRLAEIAQAEVTAVTTWGKAMGTLNFPCLIAFLRLVEDLGQAGIEPKRIVHDEQGPYQEDYCRAFEECRERNGEGGTIDGLPAPFGAIKMIDEFEFQRSVDQPMVQAADLLAGSIAHLSTALVTGRELHDQEIELGSLILPAMLFHDVRVANPVCSNQMLQKFGDALRRAYPDAANTQADDSGGSRLRWTSTLPGDGPLSLLPPKPVDEEAAPRPDMSVKIDLPLFGLANDSENQLVLLLPPEKRLAETSVDERVIPLWTDRQAAAAFLAQQEWSDPHHVVEFGPRDVPDLVAQLRDQARWANRVVVNPGAENGGPCPIDRLAEDMERIWDRWGRMVRSGLVPTLVIQEEVNGHKIMSLLMSTGRYAAMKMPDGEPQHGATREEAVAKVVATLKRE